MMLFPFAEYWWFYASFILFVLIVLALDLGVFHRKAHEVKFREALIWSVIWVSMAVVFGLLFHEFAIYRLQNCERLLAIPGFNPLEAAQQSTLQFFTGYIVEKALSVDNIFVFVVIFTYFNIPDKYQHRVLFYGILGALIFRCIFIAMGSILIQYYWVVIVFGVFLIVTGIKVLLAPEKPVEPDKNPILKLLKKFLPVSPHLDGQKFFTHHNGVRMATPLLVALILVEISDIVFAVDSVPAIFAITQDTFIVYTSNVFAILGLRSLYFALSGILPYFHFLKYGLGVILCFVGAKMGLAHSAWKIDGMVSLGVITGILAITVIASIIHRKNALRN